MATWNYRIVNMKSQNGGEDWFELREVHYDDDGKPWLHGEPCVGTETYKGLARLFAWWAAALAEDPLDESDFAGGDRAEPIASETKKHKL